MKEKHRTFVRGHKPATHLLLLLLLLLLLCLQWRVTTLRYAFLECWRGRDLFIEIGTVCKTWDHQI